MRLYLLFLVGMNLIASAPVLAQIKRSFPTRFTPVDLPLPTT